MKFKIYCKLSAIALLLWFGPSATAADSLPAPVGSRVVDFTLKDVSTGQNWSLKQDTKASKSIVLLFLSTACPVNTAYTSRLVEMAKKYKSDNVAIVGIYSHPSDDVAEISKHIKEVGYPFPSLRDEDMKLADRFAVNRVPCAIVLDSTHTVRYAGRIDDQFSPGVHKAKQTTRELANAIESIVEGNPVRVAHAPAAGCKLTREKEVAGGQSSITYHKQIARIVQANCQECHRPGEAAPFPLMTYSQVRNWSAMIQEVVEGDVMPPWHADAKFGHFKNDRRLTPEEKTTLLSWIDQGCVEGDPKDSPPPRQFIEGWRLGRQPDEVLRMKKTINVPAFGLPIVGFPYQYVPVGEPFPEDRWVTAVEVRPDYRGVIHHIIAFILPPGKSLLDLGGPDFGSHMLGAYVPGDQPVIAPPGMARKIEKGSRIIFELHYTPNGRPGPDCSSVGLCYSKEPPQNEIYNLSVMNGRFRIPPGDPNFEVKSRHTFDKPATLLSLTPHMHVRGKAFRYETVTPDGKREVILNVPKYDFSWQMSYDFAKPLQVPAGTRLECTAWYDNSDQNPFNPDPSKQVRWGNQTWDEMMIGFVTYYNTK